jgi:hypothetical protein
VSKRQYEEVFQRLTASAKELVDLQAQLQEQRASAISAETTRNQLIAQHTANENEWIAAEETLQQHIRSLLADFQTLQDNELVISDRYHDLECQLQEALNQHKSSLHVEESAEQVIADLRNELAVAKSTVTIQSGEIKRRDQALQAERTARAAVEQKEVDARSQLADLKNQLAEASKATESQCERLAEENLATVAEAKQLQLRVEALQTELASELSLAKQSQSELVNERARNAHFQQLVQQERERSQQLRDDIAEATLTVCWLVMIMLTH